MKREGASLSERVAELRLEFDKTFAVPPGEARVPTEPFLAIVAGGDNYALRLTEISGVFVDKKVVHLPSWSPDLLGIASFRGSFVPIYDLRLLLGYPGGSWPRWLALVGPKTPVGLAFDHLDGYLDVSQEAIAQEVRTDYTRRYITNTLRVAGIIRPVVGVASILETIEQRVNSSETHNDR